MASSTSDSASSAVARGVDLERIARTALALIDAPSPTCSAGPAADRLAEILTDLGFTVERPVADWPASPAVVARLDSGRPGRVLQIDGHLDTVHLPFVPARMVDGIIHGSGAADMKGGVAAEVEAVSVLRDADLLPAGGVLLTAHDHHEGPWGDKRQLQALIREGYRGDGVLLPEYLADRLPVAGRGLAIFSIRVWRDGEPMHEVLGPAGIPDVLATGADLVTRFRELNRGLVALRVEHAGSDSIFLGQLQCGEIYNQWPTECRLAGTRRWTAPGRGEEVQAEFARILAEVARVSGTHIDSEFTQYADAFALDPADPLAEAFQQAHESVTGHRLPAGGKPFVDDGSGFAEQAGIPSVTHGPAATGAHSLHEAVPVAELARVARVYALTAVAYCAGADQGRSR
ncbi:MAG: M20/M25/M40 family metallo-hydrolase [Candidatus Latescibacterota bacterium]